MDAPRESSRREKESTNSLDEVVDHLLDDLCSHSGLRPGTESTGSSSEECPVSVPFCGANDSHEPLNDVVDRLLDDLFSAHSSTPIRQYPDGLTAEATPHVPGSDEPRRRPVNTGDQQRVRPDPEVSGEAAGVYAGVAAIYFRPVRQFLLCLQEGPVSKDWLEICAPAVAMIAGAARQMEFPTADSLDRLEAVLKKADIECSQKIEGALRDQILGTCREVRGAIPELFLPNEDEDRKEVVILHSLLRLIPDVGRVTLDRIFGAGLISVEMLKQASPEALERTTGISQRLSARILDTLAIYLREREARQELRSSQEWLAAIEPVLLELETHHGALHCHEGRAARRGQGLRTRRRARTEAALRANILLAEMGETRLVEELRTLPFGGRVRRLREFVNAGST